MENVVENTRKKQSIETKNKIYEIANQLFKKYGYENVSVDSIVEMAGVSKGAFYLHFVSKDALAVSLVNDYVKEVDLDYKSYLEALDEKALASDILMSMIDKIADTLNFTIGYENIKILYKAQIAKTIDIYALMSYNRELYKMFNDIFNKGIKQGEFKAEISADMLSRHTMVALRGLTFEWCIRYPDFDLKVQALQHFNILLEGIKK